MVCNLSFNKSAKLVFVLVFILLSSINAQQPRFKFENLTTNNGLSQNIITTIFQDSRDFLWIGTSDGLNRFDGINFKIYKSDLKDSSTIHGHNFSQLVEDKEGNLWVASYGGGLNKYIRKSDTFIRYSSDPKLKDNLLWDRIKAITFDKDGYLWIGSEGGLRKMNITNGDQRIIKVKHDDPDSLNEKNIRALYTDSEGKIWIGTSNGLFIYKPVIKKYKRYLPSTVNINSLATNYIVCFEEDKNGVMWVGSTGGFHRYNKKNDDFTRFLPDANNPYSINDSDIRSILEDRNGYLWISTSNGGLNLFDREKNIFNHYQKNPFDAQSLSSDITTWLIEDRSGILWIGTYGGGLNKLSFKKSQFETFRTEPNKKDALTNNNIMRFLVESKNQIWVATYGGGLNKLVRDANGNRFINYKNDPNNPKNSLLSNKIRTLAYDKNKNILIGTEYGISKLNRATGKFQNYTTLNNSFSIDAVFALISNKNDDILLGIYGGGFSWLDKTTDGFINYTHNPNNPKTISSDIVWSIFEDSKNRIWIGTEAGLNYFDRNKKEFIHFKYDAKNPKSISDNTILTIFEDSKANIWIGTTQGLNKIIGDIEKSSDISFLKYSVPDGLPDNNIQGIVEDNDGFLWLSTNKGISKFDPVKASFKNYNTDDGLQSDGFSVGACAKIEETGELLFGGENGFNLFYPQNVSDDKHIPKIAITQLLINNQIITPGTSAFGDVLDSAIGETKEFTLPYYINDIAFEFAALHFANPANNKYAYFLEGLDTSWNYIGNRRFASFTNLPPGEYVFKVKGSNHNGYWNQEGASIKIIITPPFWLTWPFRIVTILFVIISIYAGYKFKTRSIEKRSKQLAVLVDERTDELQRSNRNLEDEIIERRVIEEKLIKSKEDAESANRAKSEFLANISHELRTPLNAILGYTQILRKQTNLTEIQKDQLITVQQSGEHLLTLINDILDLRRIEAHKDSTLSIEFNLRMFIEEVISTVRVKAIEKDLAFNYEEVTDLPSQVIGDPKKTKQVLLNLLGNAIKYTNKGSVTFKTASQEFIPATKLSRETPLTKARINFEVIDTGPGIEESKLDKLFQPFISREEDSSEIEGTGLGLAITKKIVEILGGHITVKSNVGIGTTFSVELEFEISQIQNATDVTTASNIIGYSGQRKTILLVDDNSTNRNMLTSTLEPLGFMIETASNGIEALQSIRNKMPNIMLIDLLMPDLDGLKTMEIIREDKSLCSLKAIGVSAAVADASRMEKFAILCDDLVSKPINTNALLDVIEKHLNLTWILDQDINLTLQSTRQKTKTNITEIIKPSEDVLERIIKHVGLGDFGTIDNILNELISEEKYIPFVNKVKEFSKQFDEEAIIKLCS
jgi:signal transduction histidine kinase/ligand-binding sensor domain-containing protein/DNA-binding NarL/FixJ family response regulator